MFTHGGGLHYPKIAAPSSSVKNYGGGFIMRKNLHYKIMLSILAGSLALGFVYAQPAFAVDVMIANGENYTAPDGTQGTYKLDADGTNNGTNYGDEKGYTSITLPTGPIGTFTVTAGNGGLPLTDWSTGGKGGSILLSAIGNAINNGVSITAGKGGHSELGDSTGGAGGAGGAGGDVTLTFTNVVNGNINAEAGNGGYIYAPYDNNGNLTGGDGGNATLTFTNVVTDSISLTSGTNGHLSGTGYNCTPGNGGSVNFTAENIKASSSNSQLLIIFNKNYGDIKFTANTLEVQNGTVIIAGSCTPADGSNNHINTLLLTGSGNIDVSDNIKIGSLTIDGGTIVSDARTTNVWKNIIGRDYTTKTITIGTKGATFNIVDSDRTNILTKSVTGAGNLTKTGAGTLKLTGSTYDYTGLTVVEQGTLDASAIALTNSKGLTLFGGATFIANTSNQNWTGTKQNWKNKQIAVYDNGSDNSAIYQGDLSAQTSNLYFIASGDNTNPLLKVISNGTGNNGNVNIAGSNYNLGLTGDKFLDIGSKLTLIEADGTINADNLEPGSGIKVGSTIKQDITTNVEVSVDDSGSTEKLIATVNGALATDEASAINSGMLGGLAFNLQGADLIAREGMEAAIRSAQLDNNHAVFAALTRSSLDYGTVDVDGTNMLAGLAWRSTTGAGSMTYGVFAEHGDGSYDTYANINGTSLHGEGDTDYTGGGILARIDFNGSENGHGYLEASGRVGNADTDYTNSGLRDAYGRAASYSTDGTYYGAHIGAGYVQKLDEKSSIDWYGKLLWARLEGGSADLSTGEHLTFDDADSLRLRIGGRWNYAASDFVNYYAGLGYEYEFDGEASGFTNGLALGDEDLTGGSGVAELGISFKPSKNSPFSLELNLTGFTGEREGFRGGVEAVYTF
jgi:autotransporter-associated beta strand protein